MILALVAILLAAALFTNAVEILGVRLGWGQGAVGSVLAAVGTALPETMIPVVAIFGALIAGSGAGAASEIGIGAILGAPFLLATLAMFVVGAAAITFQRRRGSGALVTIDEGTALRDVVFFIVCFALAAAAGIIALPFSLKVVLVVFLIAAYVFYTVRTVQSGGGEMEDAPEKLRLWPFGSRPPMWAVIVQNLGALVVMAAGAHFFVDAVEKGSHAVGIPAGLVALVLAPLATEMPEKLNSVIWLRDNKDTMALGNITGAMVFQSTIPVSLGLLFTQWRLDFLTTFSAVLALVSGVALLGLLLRKVTPPIRPRYLLVFGSLYAVFIVTAILVIF